MPAYRKKPKRKKIIAIALLILAVLSVILYFNYISYPMVLSVTEAQAKLETVNAVNSAVVKIRKLESFYGVFYNYERNNEGEVVLVTANTTAINQFYVTAQTEIQAALNDLNEKDLNVPLGVFTGSALLASLGPDISLRVRLVGTSEALLNSFFYQEGINQTIHRVVLRVTTKLNILIPAKATGVTVTTDFVVAEDLIIGRVPDSYITGISQDNIFDLLPG